MLKMLVKNILCLYCRSILWQNDTMLDFSFPSSCNDGGGDFGISISVFQNSLK